MSSPCPDRNQLLDYLLGKLPDPPAGEVAAHVEGCPTCERTVRSLEVASDTLVAQLRGPLPESQVAREAPHQQAMAKIEQLAQPPATPEEPAAVEKPPAAVEKPTESQPADSKAATGRFGEYRLLAKLGQGGMGVVWKAEHLRMHRLVAIKVLPRAQMQSPEAVRRFYREVEAAAQLAHPNIVTAYDAREHQGVTSWPWSTSTARIWLGSSKRAGRCRCARPPSTCSRPRADWPTPTAVESSTATSSRAICWWTARGSSRSWTWAWPGWIRA
jgi:hypothetical protein